MLALPHQAQHHRFFAEDFAHAAVESDAIDRVFAADGVEGAEAGLPLLSFGRRCRAAFDGFSSFSLLAFGRRRPRSPACRGQLAAVTTPLPDALAAAPPCRFVGVLVPTYMASAVTFRLRISAWAAW